MKQRISTGSNISSSTTALPTGNDEKSNDKKSEVNNLVANNNMQRTSSTPNEFFAHEPGQASISSWMKSNQDDLVKQRDELQNEVTLLKQQLKEAQLLAVADSGEQEQGKTKTLSDETVERIEMMAQQLNDSRREVQSLNEIMSVMKARLDGAESDRRKLSSELAKLKQAKEHCLQEQPHSQQSSAASNCSDFEQKSARDEQYPTLKRQVKQILLRQQDMA